MDYSASPPYLLHMVNRLLLTLLALLTGLSAQIGPAEARVSQVASMQVAVLGEQPSAKPSRAPVALAQLPEPGRLNTRRHAATYRAVLAPRVVLLPVLTGIDRARE